MSKQLLPHVQPQMLKEQPDQFCALFNRVVDRLNALEQK